MFSKQLTPQIPIEKHKLSFPTAVEFLLPKQFSKSRSRGNPSPYRPQHVTCKAPKRPLTVWTVFNTVDMTADKAWSVPAIYKRTSAVSMTHQLAGLNRVLSVAIVKCRARFTTVLIEPMGTCVYCGGIDGLNWVTINSEWSLGRRNVPPTYWSRLKWIGLHKQYTVVAGMLSNGICKDQFGTQ